MIGFLAIDKPSDMSSAKVVTLVKKQFHLKKIGHMGTLDPMASGVLPLAVGKATRLFDYFLEKKKTYLAEFEFGYETDTLDRLGTTIKQSARIPGDEEIRKVISKFVGDIDQIPPAYSAKHVDGKRAYELARNGVEVQLNAKKVTIHDFKLVKKINNTKYQFSITCSSGTYIRSIARDLGYQLNTYATMTNLRRVESGYFTTNNAITIEELKDTKDLNAILIAPTEIFSKYEKMQLTKDELKWLQDGKCLKMNTQDGFYWLMYQDRIVGLGESKNSLIKIRVYLWEENNG